PRPALPDRGPRPRRPGSRRVPVAALPPAPDVPVVHARPGVARRRAHRRLPVQAADRLARGRAPGRRAPFGRRTGGPERSAPPVLRGTDRGGPPLPRVRGEAGRRNALHPGRPGRRSAPRARLLPGPVVTDLHDRAGPARTSP